MSRRVLPPPGLSYVDANLGRVVTFGPDVTDMKRRIEARWPSLECVWDKDQMTWLIIEHCEDHVERLFFSTRELDERAYNRCATQDPEWWGYKDFAEEIDEHNERREKEIDDKFGEKIQEGGERLIHALKKDGFFDHENIYGPAPKPIMAGKAVRRYKIGESS